MERRAKVAVAAAVAMPRARAAAADAADAAAPVAREVVVAARASRWSHSKGPSCYAHQPSRPTPLVREGTARREVLALREEPRAEAPAEAARPAKAERVAT